MSLHEPRCLVCGAPLGKGAPFEKDVRNSEVCSDECYNIYMCNEDEDNQETIAQEYTPKQLAKRIEKTGETIILTRPDTHRP